MTHFNDKKISHVLHRQNELHRTTALQEVLETPRWHEFSHTQADIDFMHADPTGIHES
jgi:hypothetical protein